MRCAHLAAMLLSMLHMDDFDIKSTVLFIDFAVV